MFHIIVLCLLHLSIFIMPCVIMFYLLFLIDILLLLFVEIWCFILFLWYFTFFYLLLLSFVCFINKIYHVFINIILAIASSMCHFIVHIIVLAHYLHHRSCSWHSTSCYHELVFTICWWCVWWWSSSYLYCEIWFLMCSCFYLSFTHNTLLMIVEHTRWIGWNDSVRDVCVGLKKKKWYSKEND